MSRQLQLTSGNTTIVIIYAGCSLRGGVTLSEPPGKQRKTESAYHKTVHCVAELSPSSRTLEDQIMRIGKRS